MTINPIRDGKYAEKIENGERVTVVGILERIIDTFIDHASGNLFTNKITRVPSAILHIKSSGEVHEVLFPRLISFNEGKDIVDQRVMYTHEHTSFYEPLGDLVGDDYTLEILEGKKAGLKYLARLVD